MNTEKAEKQAAYRLINIPGIGKQSAHKLVAYAGSASAGLNLEEKDARSVLSPKNADAFIRGRENVIKKDVECMEKETMCTFIPYTSPEYPEKLKHIPDPPFALYVRGEMPVSYKPAVAVIGARACSEYGKNIARYFGRALGNAGIQIISGMARGIDGIAQEGALDGKSKTFAVLGCGADVCYPPENESLYRRIVKQGGIISEYPPGTKAQNCLFPPRNRIISGLADVILVIEARKRSGTYITVTQALEQGKEVFAVPGRITDAVSEGCNYLLSQGAGVAIRPENITDALKMRYEACENGYFMNVQEQEDEGKETALYKSKGVETQGIRERILSGLDMTPVALDVLYDRICTSVPVSMEELLLELIKMEMEGVLTSTGNYYRLTYTL